MEKYLSLREQYPEFIYNGYNIEFTEDNLKVTYDFQIIGLSEFHPTWIFPMTETNFDSELLENMIFNLGMVELVSYWKITCSSVVRVLCGSMDNEQIMWWKKLYFKGLGEFFYVNSIEADFSDFMDIKASGKEHIHGSGVETGNAVLIPVGGGKDSAVTIELLKRYNAERYAYIINSRGATEATVAAAGIEDKTVRVKRTLDKNMLELNKQGFLNGHTPFSALVAFSSVILSHIHGMKFVALSNESSANESTVSGSDVNHQYSKSFEFESDFNCYEKKYIKSGVEYFSFLRPLSEYQIAKLFSAFGHYHDVFRSCNAGSKEDIWCGKCPKCLFVFLIMSPHIGHDRLVEVFGRDMLNDSEMLSDFKKLIGELQEKPFECVGSRDEINFSVVEAIKGFEGRLPKLLEYYKTTDLFKKYSTAQNPYNDYYNTEHLLSLEFEAILKDALKEI